MTDVMDGRCRERDSNPADGTGRREGDSVVKCASPLALLEEHVLSREPLDDTRFCGRRS